MQIFETEWRQSKSDNNKYINSIIQNINNNSEGKSPVEVLKEIFINENFLEFIATESKLYTTKNIVHNFNV